MSDLHIPQVTPASPIARSAPVQPVRRDRPTNEPFDSSRPGPNTVVAATGGSLRPAYAQYVVDPTTHDTVVRIRDANTGAVISETPTPEVQAMVRAMKAYVDTVARHRAALAPMVAG
jgi:FlaG protein